MKRKNKKVRQKQRELEPMAIPGEKTVEVMDLPIAKLVRPKYQEKRNNATTLQKMRKNWDWNLCQVIDVAPNSDGTFNVIDGWTRATALQEMGVQIVAANVHDNLTDNYEAQALMFERLHRQRNRIAPIATFFALTEGRDPLALQVHDVVDSLGLEFGNGRTGSSIGAVNCVLKVAARSGPKVLADVLYTLHVAWPDTSAAYGRELLFGAEKLLVDYPGMVDLNHLAKRLGRSFTPESFIARGTANGVKGEKGKTGITDLMKHQYNLQLRTSPRLPEYPLRVMAGNE